MCLEPLSLLEADHAIDYTQTDITQSGQQFDLILDPSIAILIG
jgi:hypothetical protein